jgi:hypothetical protein
MIGVGEIIGDNRDSAYLLSVLTINGGSVSNG